MGILGLGLLLGIVLTAVGLIVATAIRSIDLEDMSSIFRVAIGLTFAGWAMSFLWPFILPDNPDPTFIPGWGVYATMYRASFAINTVALGLTSLFVSGFKIRDSSGCSSLASW